MVVGLGIDLVERGRVARILERWGERFVGKLMGEEEARSVPRHPGERAEHLAHAIAAKEAASKALGTGWSRGVHWRQVEVRLGEAPSLVLTDRAREVARALGSSGACRLLFESRGDLLIGSVLLFSHEG